MLLDGLMGECLVSIIVHAGGDTAREITNFHIHYFTGCCVKLQPDNKLLHKNSVTLTSEVLMRMQLLQANISRFAILPKEQRKRMSVRDLQSTQIL